LKQLEGSQRRGSAQFFSFLLAQANLWQFGVHLLPAGPHEGSRVSAQAGPALGAEVGYEPGFSNLSHFSRLFEKHYGLHPKRYSQS